MKDLLITLFPLCAAIYTASIRERFRVTSSEIGIVISSLMIISFWADCYFSWIMRARIIATIMLFFDIGLVYAWVKSKNSVRRMFYMTYAVVNLIFVLYPLSPLKPVSCLTITIALLVGIPRIISNLKADGTIK